MITSTILSKVPVDIRLIVSRGFTDGDWELDGMMKKLKQGNMRMLLK